MLRSVPLYKKGSARLLSAALPTGQDVGDLSLPFEWTFRISPDSKHVLYAADQDADDVIELYSSPIDGSLPPTRLNPSYSGSQDVFLTRYQPAFEADSTSSRVV